MILYIIASLSPASGNPTSILAPAAANLLLWRRRACFDPRSPFFEASFGLVGKVLKQTLDSNQLLLLLHVLVLSIATHAFDLGLSLPIPKNNNLSTGFVCLCFSFCGAKS